MKSAEESAPIGTAPPKLLEFLDQIFDSDRETIDLFQVRCGVILFGHQHEEKLLFALFDAHFGRIDMKARLAAPPVRAASRANGVGFEALFRRLGAALLSRHLGPAAGR